ncbi:MAG: hypothetical protein ACHQ7M_16260 [Chloroflexota bacterium]
MRGRINVPLNSINDVIVVALLLVVLFSVAAWLWSGGAFADLADLLRPKAMATLLEIEIALAGAGDLAAVLPVKENAVPSAALELAQRVSDLLLARRDTWCRGAFHCSKVPELEAAAAWNAAWQRAQPPATEAGETVIVKLVVLISGRTIQPPKQVTGETLAALLRGLPAIGVSYIAAFAAVCVPATEAEALSAL